MTEFSGLVRGPICSKPFALDSCFFFVIFLSIAEDVRCRADVCIALVLCYLSMPEGCVIVLDASNSRIMRWLMISTFLW